MEKRSCLRIEENKSCRSLNSTFYNLKVPRNSRVLHQNGILTAKDVIKSLPLILNFSFHFYLRQNELGSKCHHASVLHHGHKKQIGLHDMKKVVMFGAKLRLPMGMPILKAKLEIDTETENYKELDSYESYDLRDLRIDSSTISLTLVVALTSCIEFRGKSNFCVSESRHGGHVLYN